MKIIVASKAMSWKRVPQVGSSKEGTTRREFMVILYNFKSKMMRPTCQSSNRLTLVNSVTNRRDYENNSTTRQKWRKKDIKKTNEYSLIVNKSCINRYLNKTIYYSPVVNYIHVSFLRIYLFLN